MATLVSLGLQLPLQPPQGDPFPLKGHSGPCSPGKKVEQKGEIALHKVGNWASPRERHTGSKSTHAHRCLVGVE